MKTNDLKKGDHVSLRNGWAAEIMDSQKGNIRSAMVHGIYSEIGSIYAHDIVTGRKANEPGEWHFMEYTAAQVKLRKTVNLVDWGMVS